MLPILISVLSDGEFHSENQIRSFLGLNYSEIKKYIKIFQEWGIDILTILDNGYQLKEPLHLLNQELIQKEVKKGSVFILPVIDSTNQYLLDHLDILHSGDVCLAEYQKKGRGRHGRKWFSSFGSNLYLSMYWSFKGRSITTISLGLVISIIVAIVLHDLGANQIKIKWPNDLYLLGRKLAGILVELVDRTNLVQVVIGIGINLAFKSSREGRISRHWINLQEVGVNIDRNILSVRLIKELRIFLKYFEKNGLISLLSKWKELDNFINRPVKLLIDDKEIYGISRGINEYGALMLEQDGVIKPWIRGEISLRGIKDY